MSLETFMMEKMRKSDRWVRIRPNSSDEQGIETDPRVFSQFLRTQVFHATKKICKYDQTIMEVSNDYENIWHSVLYKSHCPQN